MYSLVLMSAMTAAPDEAGFNGYFRDLFSRGSCTGSCGGTPVRYACVGGCSGAARYDAGCCGGGGLFSGERVRRLFDRGSGCCGGSARSYGCSGSYSCFGSGYSCAGSMAYSCFGGPAVSYTPVALGCQGGGLPGIPVPESYPYPTVPGGPPPVIPYADPQAAPPSSNLQTGGLRPAGYNGPAGFPVGGSGGARATVVVRLPVDAKLLADGTPLKLAGAERKFVTPPLPAGMEYTYRFTVEYDRDGRTLSESRNVAVRAGGTAGLDFADLTATAGKAPARDAAADPAPSPAADKPSVLTSLGGGSAGVPALTPAPTPTAVPEGKTARAAITVKLPPGATLYVDDRKSPSAESVRRFNTPPLPVGKEFSYLLRVETTRDGLPTRMTERVAVRAGEERAIDFTAVGGP
ncbi:MAG: TIGR03000 domain-containing protein [Gemmataceae bacterium]|nr:TIGR03000 domain-containing protein [Gemmataceae bacterium]